MRFSSESQRNRGEGTTVHIYLEEGTVKYITHEVRWQIAKGDNQDQYRVYRNRTAWPPGASASEAPWAPCQEPQQRRETPSTLGLRESQPPVRPAWSQPLTASGRIGTSIAPSTSQAESSCPPSCRGIQWTSGSDSNGPFVQGRRADGTLARKRGNRYTDEYGNEITT